MNHMGIHSTDDSVTDNRDLPVRPRLLNLRFGAVQAAYWFENCAICGFAASYLMQFGFSLTAIGLLIACSCLVTCVLQPLIGDFADRTKRFTLKQIVCAFSAVGVVIGFGLEFSAGQTMVFVLYALATILVVTLQPLVNALGLAYGDKVNYGFSRGLGSVSFAIAAAFIGWAISRLGATFIDGTILVCWAALFAFTAAFPSPARKTGASPTNTAADNPHDALPSSGNAGSEPRGADATGIVGHGSTASEDRELAANGIRFLKRYRLFAFILLGGFLVILSHSEINAFFIRIVEPLGGGNTEMGIALAIAGVVELPMMSLYVVLRRRFSCEAILLFSASMFFVKAFATWLAFSVEALYLAMLLQAISFALYFPAIVDYAQATMHVCDKVKGQTVLLSVHTLSLVVAGLVGGFLLDDYGLTATMLVCCIAAALGACVIGVALFVARRKASAHV